MKDDYSGSLDEVCYRTIRGWAVKRSAPDERLRVILRVNGRVAGRDTTRPMGSGTFELISDSEIIGTDWVQVDVYDGSDRVVGTFRWGDSTRMLPEQWRATDAYALPSLFLIGAAKSGTTSLHVALDEHPDVFMAKPKEPYFFEAEFERGAEFYFRKYFGGWKGEQFVGESRHRNLYLPYVPERIHAFNPRAKLLAILRDPAERAVSHWWHWRSRGAEPLSPFEAFQADLKRVRKGTTISSPVEIREYGATLDSFGKAGHRTYIDTGYYAEQLERYLALFERKQLHVVLFEEFVREPQAILAKIFEFLGADPAYAKRTRCTYLNQSPAGMWEHVDDRTWRWLQEHYDPHNRRLGQLISRPLTGWERSRPR
jgi:Sulfotransferase domain